MYFSENVNKVKKNFARHKLCEIKSNTLLKQIRQIKHAQYIHNLM